MISWDTNVKVNDEGFVMHIVSVDVTGIGPVMIEVPANNSNDAINNALHTLTHIKYSDVELKSVGAVRELV